MRIGRFRRASPHCSRNSRRIPHFQRSCLRFADSATGLGERVALPNGIRKCGWRGRFLGVERRAGQGTRGVSGSQARFLGVGLGGRAPPLKRCTRPRGGPRHSQRSGSRFLCSTDCDGDSAAWPNGILRSVSRRGAKVLCFSRQASPIEFFGLHDDPALWREPGGRAWPRLQPPQPPPHRPRGGRTTHTPECTCTRPPAEGIRTSPDTVSGSCAKRSERRLEDEEQGEFAQEHPPPRRLSDQDGERHQREDRGEGRQEEGQGGDRPGRDPLDPAVGERHARPGETPHRDPPLAGAEAGPLHAPEEAERHDAEHRRRVTARRASPPSTDQIRTGSANVGWSRARNPARFSRFDWTRWTSAARIGAL